MMDTKSKSLPLDLKVSKEPVNLVSQHGCGAIHFARTSHAGSGRFFGLDHVIDPTGSRPYTTMPSVVRFGKFPGQHAIPEYLDAIWKVEPCPVP